MPPGTTTLTEPPVPPPPSLVPLNPAARSNPCPAAPAQGRTQTNPKRALPGSLPLQSSPPHPPAAPTPATAAQSMVRHRRPRPQRQTLSPNQPRNRTHLPRPGSQKTTSAKHPPTATRPTATAANPGPTPTSTHPSERALIPSLLAPVPPASPLAHTVLPKTILAAHRRTTQNSSRVPQTLPMPPATASSLPSKMSK